MMLYDGLFRFLNEAKTALEVRDMTRAGERINRSHAILEELASTLDPTHAPELCDNLRGVYTFAMGHLVQANVRRDPELVSQVLRILTPIRDGFREAVRSTSQIK